MAKKRNLLDIDCRATDYDFCAAGFFGEKHLDGLHRIFIRRGVPRVIVEEVSQEVDVMGFTIDRLTEQIKLRPGIASLRNEAGIKGEFKNWLSRKHALYEDTKRVLTRWRRSGIKVPIVTRGVADYQWMKIQSTGIPHDGMYCVQPPVRKSAALRELLKRYPAPIMFIDDRLLELDGVRDDGLMESDVVTVWMRRPDGPYNSGTPKYRHYEVEHFAEIDLL